jgi:hypothetical protein
MTNDKSKIATTIINNNENVPNLNPESSNAAD